MPSRTGSITDIVKNHGVPPDKIVVGKIVTSGDGNNGWVDPATFAAILRDARRVFPSLRGAMGWQWGSDTAGAWSRTIAGGLGAR